MTSWPVETPESVSLAAPGKQCSKKEDFMVWFRWTDRGHLRVNPMRQERLSWPPITGSLRIGFSETLPIT